MGFDPMTHRPRTDIFSSLPHLIALANLKDLIEHQTWEEQAVRLQTEAVQMARLQYLQYLLQPPPSSSSSSATFSNNINTATDMETYNNLLNSLSSMKDNPVLNTTQFETSNPIDSIPFSHMPDLQVPGSFQLTDMNSKELVLASDFTVPSHGENSPTTTTWLPSTSSPSPPPLAAPPVPDISTTNMGDACSSSSYEGGHSSFWPEFFLEDPTFFHEIA
ncbi:hypothetical protein U1Q18_039532 [Sarracenia purpurea var. burkii]